MSKESSIPEEERSTHSIMTALESCMSRIDHIAIAVVNLDESVAWYSKVLGFSVIETRLTDGVSSGMRSTVMKCGDINFVLLEGTSPQSQVSKFIERYGPGVQHVALRVTDIETTVRKLRETGLEFDTSIIGSSALRQAFSRRHEGSGMMFELIQRNSDGFADQNVAEMFIQLEQKGTF
jgi:methylmalonyl-CoA/ethylmalonyl-CoA epimerase